MYHIARVKMEKPALEEKRCWRAHQCGRKLHSARSMDIQTPPTSSKTTNPYPHIPEIREIRKVLRRRSNPEEKSLKALINPRSEIRKVLRRRSNPEAKLGKSQAPIKCKTEDLVGQSQFSKIIATARPLK